MRGCFAYLLVLLAGCSNPSEETPTPDSGLSQDPEDYRDPPTSCALACSSDYAQCEPNGYQCPALSEWSKLPHASTCKKWDGKYPTPVQGKCKSSLPTGAAAKKTGVDPDDANTTILPTGYRAKPTGKSIALGDTSGGFASNVLSVDGTDFVVVIDTGIKDHAVRLVDTAAMTIKTVIKYGGNENLTHGAVLVGKRLYVTGGYGSNAKILAFDIDTTKGELVANTAANIPIPLAGGGGLISKGAMPSGITARPDGKLVVATQHGPSRVMVVDPMAKAVTATIPITGSELFSVFIHPSDTAGKYAFVSVWDSERVDVVDLDAAKVVKSINVGKAPQAFVPLDSRYLALVSSDADVITVFDTLPDMWAKISETKVVEGSGYGWAPSGAHFDAANKRLYVTLAGLNALAVFDIVAGATPSLSLKGMLGTEWWPTAVTQRPDGSLLVVNGKGRGTGANPIQFKPSEGNITSIMKGSVQLVPRADADAATKTTIDALTDLSKLEGAPKVDCAGAPYDFPIPATNKEGPSKVIKKIVFAIKENKTFDAVFGDLPGVEGDPKLIMAPGLQDTIFANQRKAAKTFTNFDNYYTSAEQSIQGHVWTAYGRTTEFIERTWLYAWGRGIRSPIMGVELGKPVEGSMFDWLLREKVPFDNMGELAGAPKEAPGQPGLDTGYPGRFYAQNESDARKACYINARARVLCDLKPFTYAVMPNDHTAGGSADTPRVEVYIAVGDEGTGQLLEGLSKSPDWGETLLVVTMDDPQDGGDHVDAHRTPLIFASPWVKRGYVSKGHYDTSSLHKLFAHILGIDYPNEIVARASLPLDAFTSTPDYTPYDHVKRTVVLACNPKSTSYATEAAMSSWDLSQPDQAPGIGRQVWEILHEGKPAPAGYGDDDDD